MVIRGVEELRWWCLRWAPGAPSGDRSPLCCDLRHSHVATLLQNETFPSCEFAQWEFSNCDIFSLWDSSQIATFLHNENLHNATTSQYANCCILRQHHYRALPLVLQVNTLCSKYIPSNQCKPLESLKKSDLLHDLNWSWKGVSQGKKLNEIR